MESQGTVATARQIKQWMARAGELKGELVAFAQGPRFSRMLDARLMGAADEYGDLDESTFIAVVDHFALQHRLPDGSTVVERFVSQRRPAFSEADREMLLGWRDVVEGILEVRSHGGDHVVLHNLLDDLVYRTYSNMGRRPLKTLREGMFVLVRLVPVDPAADIWLISGNISTFPASTGPRLARSAVETLTIHPRLMHRNADLVRRSWEMHTEARADFIAMFGSDLIIAPPHEVQAKLRDHHKRRLESAAIGSPTAGSVEATVQQPTLDQLTELPPELLEAETIAVLYDEQGGLGYYADCGRLDELFAAPETARDRERLTLLREYLNDDSVPPAVIRRLVERHPQGADTVFRKLLRKPDFSWSEHGEDLLRRRKKRHFAEEPWPGVTVVGDRLAELLRT